MEKKKTVLPSYLKKTVDKYKCVLLLGAVGLCLLFWPKTGDRQTQPVLQAQEEDAALLLAHRLEELFQTIDGVGDARVLLTTGCGSETVYVFDEERSASKDDRQAQSSATLSLATASGGEAVVSRVNAPVFTGAVVVCEGADSAAVRLALTDAVRSLTGISADHIVIAKMK